MLRTHENRYAEQLDMVYKGNRLTKVSKNGDPNLEYDFQGYPDKANASTEMTYDPNGNMTADLDRGIVAIRYNLLNLPDTVQFENGNRIVYFYYAGGERAGAVTTTYSTPISVPLDSVYLGEDPHFDMWEHRHGNLFYKMGSPSRLLFDDGFFELAERHGGLISQIPYVFVRDHIGSVRLVCNVNTGEVVQSLEYLPSGVIFRSRNFDRQPYRFTGKELLSAHGLDWYDSGARMQEFHIPRFTTMDPLCEKYYSISPYAYCNNNPVNYVDPDGREVQVAKEYQEQFRNDLQNVFGDRINMLSFNDNGTLQLDGKTKDFTKEMTKDQKEAFKGLNKAMNDKQVTSVVYADNYNITVNGEVKSVDIVKEYGGGLYSKTDNLIIIAPSVRSVDVTLDQIQITADGLGFPSQNVQQNTTSTLFHEIGERNTTNINFRGVVIDFENYVRRTIGLPVRPYDLNHSKTIKTNYTK